MATQWTKKMRRETKTDFRLLDVKEAASMISETVGVPLDLAENAVAALETYNNSTYFRSDDVSIWIERNANRLRFAHQGRGA
jgi:hypothetical protein